MGRVGIVPAEVSRLARNNADWHRLSTVLASSPCFCDEDGLYDPSLNDRLLWAEGHDVRGRASTSSAPACGAASCPRRGR